MREQLRQIKLWKVIFAAVGILLVGTGVAFNARAALGNDPIGIIYDGVRNAANLTAEQLGMTSNIVNIVLLVLVFLADRHYVNLGTFIYLIPYGFAVDLGRKLYQALIPAQTLPFQILGAFIGCLLLYVGVAMFITMDMGVDPFTGVVLVLRDRAPHGVPENQGNLRPVHDGTGLCAGRKTGCDYDPDGHHRGTLHPGLLRPAQKIL